MRTGQLISIESPENTLPCKTYYELRDSYREFKDANLASYVAHKVEFLGIPEGKDAYNPSGPLVEDGQTYQWARVESREGQDAISMLFKEVKPCAFELVDGASILPCEDPFTFSVHGERYVGGVKIRKDEHGFVVGYRTLFYRGPLNALECFTSGPEDMKDIRFVELPDSLFVFTRPYIPEGARMVGRVAITNIHSIDEVTPERLLPEHTELIPGLFAPTEWGGVNDAYLLPGTHLIGALGHVSKFDSDGKRHYAAMVFVIDPVLKLCTPIEMIAERLDFPMGPVKIMPEYLNLPEMHDDLADVIFPSRLTPIDGDLMSSPLLTLTCGLSDASVGTLTVPNPFPRLCTLLA